MATADEDQFSPEDLQGIVMYVNEFGPSLFAQIVHSICPTIFGYEMVKGGKEGTHRWPLPLYFTQTSEHI